MNAPVTQTKPDFVDEGAKVEDKAVTAVSTTTVPSKVIKSAQPPKAQEKTQKSEVANNNDELLVKQKPSGGFLYRGQLNVTNVDMIAPKIKEKIEEFGGRKAGEAEIGWKKSSNLYYYHFTIPEAKLAELEQYLKLYSEAKLSKTPHPRVMPDGIIRIIFTVEEKQQPSNASKEAE